MTPLENLTSAFETLWETKIYLLRTAEAADPDFRPKLNAALDEVATARNHVEKLLIELLAKTPAAPPPPQG